MITMRCCAHFNTNHKTAAQVAALPTRRNHLSKYHLMCEFCSFGPNTKHKDRDANDPFAFGGFFSSDAINEAVRASKQLQQKRKDDNDGSSDKEAVDDGEDSDGT